ncbi:MAG TPA: type II toxin-antitoxin system VapC family toxin [Gammaproteobacteria bacterium]|nr:type II toxin-antitoxin system VapC family toxin [Gammaproteobacteria bacterium]
MKFLLDTHVLLWAGLSEATTLDKTLSDETRALIMDPSNTLYFSPANVWEVAIKNALGRANFRVDPHVFRRALLDNGYLELPITSEHTAGVATLPDYHKDPFDRLLIAQATIEGITLLTNDETLAAYTSSPVRFIAP